MAEYWDRYWSRRRLLGATGLGIAGTASLALVGCGGGGNSNNPSLSKLATPSAQATKVDPFAGATPGGTLGFWVTGDPATIDPYGNASFTTKTISAYVYSRLFKYKTGIDVLRADVHPTGDLAASAESTPDGLQWTVKLRQGINFHNVAPVNGRAVTTDDIKFSWGRLTDPKNAARVQVNFVDKVTFPDASTAVFSLNAPFATFLDSLSDSNLLWIMPTEADGKFDPAKTMIGSGPWLFDSYTPSQSYKMKKNPNWYEQGFPLLDGIDVAIIPDNANRLSQFLAGNLDTLSPVATDLIEIMKTVKNVQVASYKGQGANWLWFDGTDPNAPYVKDERIRQAMSMAVDRDALNDLAYNTKQLQAAGLNVSTDWNNLISAGWGRWALDPKSAKMGDAAKFWQYNPTGAQQLLSAAGFTPDSPLQVTYQYPATIYGKNFDDSAQATGNYIGALNNMKLATDVQDYASKYITQTFLGNFKGLAFGLETGFPEVGNFPVRLFTDNSANHGRVSDPVLTKFANDQRIERDDSKRVQLFQDAQIYHASKLWYIPLQIASGETWIVNQPTLHNNNGFFTLSYGAPTESAPYWWKSKA
jgi:peptide/nickel transport system substrate-binding protein